MFTDNDTNTTGAMEETFVDQLDKEQSTPMQSPLTQLPIPAGFKNPTTLTNCLKVFLFLSIAIFAVAIWSDLSERQYLINYQNGVYATEQEAATAAQDVLVRQGIIGIAAGIIVLTQMILFFVWVYRANKNVRALGAQGLRFTPGWAVGWFFVPIAHFWKPYQVVKEIFMASNNPKNWRQHISYPILGWWWFFWVVSVYLSNISFRVSLHAEAVDELLMLNLITMISQGLDIMCAGFTIYLVVLIYKMQMWNLRKQAEPTNQPQQIGPEAQPQRYLDFRSF